MDVGVGEAPPDAGGQVPHFLNRLSGLRGHAETRPRRQRHHVGLIEHDVEGVEVFRESPYFDMSALPDDHGVVAVADERLDGAMRHVHERARRVHDLETERARAGHGPLRRAVRRHHDGPGRDQGRILRGRDPSGTQPGEDGVVVHEIAEDRQRRRVAPADRELDGIPNTETHSEVRCAQDFHGPTLHRKDSISFAW